MTVLAPALEHARLVWEQELAYARGSGEPIEEVAQRRATVLIDYEGAVPDLRSAGVEPGFDAGGRITGIVAFADLERLESLDGVTQVFLQPTVAPTLDGTVKEMKVPWQNPSGGGFQGRGSGVIVAVIDTGIDIFHESFVNPDGTSRILELWDQTAGLAGGSNPPAGFTQIGKVYSQQQLTAAIAAGPPFASRDTNGHGTHVAGTAAGSGRQDDRCSFPGHYVGVAPEADLVIVKAIGVTNSDLVSALNWCAQAGTRNPGNKAVVINCSFGHATGPHDGTDPLDVSFDAVLRPSTGIPEGLAVIGTAGNTASDDIHETGTVQPAQTVTVPFYIPEGSFTSDVLDIWYDGAASLGVEVIAPPNPAFPGTNTTGVVLPPSNTAKTIGGMILPITSTAAQPASSNMAQISVSFTVAPPATPPPPGTTPPKVAIRSGVWQLKLSHVSGPAATWNAWFATSHGDSFPTWRLPTDPSGVVARRQENTVGSPGSARNLITVAAYSDGNGKLADFSSRGRSSQPGVPVGEFKPTVAAPGVAVAAPRSRDYKESNSSCCDQLVIDMDGTSMAAPHVTGLVALLFAKNKHLTFEQARAHLQHSARIDGIPAAEVPPEVDATMHIRANGLWGSGKVDALLALNEVPPAAALGGGGGGGGGGNPAPVMFVETPMDLGFTPLGYTPHTWPSRLMDWRRRYADHPGVLLLAALVSEHVDEVLWLLNNDRKVLVTWRRNGGHLLVRRLLYGPPPSDVLIPAEVDGYDVGSLLERITDALSGVGGSRLRADIASFGAFARSWPGATLAQLDDAALRGAVTR